VPGRKGSWISTIFEGTNEIQRLMIARAISEVRIKERRWASAGHHQVHVATGVSGESNDVDLRGM
jgi:hypothetical protein